MTEMTKGERVIPELTKGWRLRMALEHAGLSVQAMADELGVSTATIQRWARDRGPIRRPYLLMWAMRTGVPMEWLENGTTPASAEGPDGGGGGYAIRDSNPEPADLEDDALTWDDAA